MRCFGLFGTKVESEAKFSAIDDWQAARSARAAIAPLPAVIAIATPLCTSQ
jgi:hypothetical protein